MKQSEYVGLNGAKLFSPKNDNIKKIKGLLQPKP